MEIWDLYTKDRVKTGETMVRGDQLKENTYHLVVHVCIFNSDGKMLIQQRQPFKEGWPNMWDITVGGSAIFGDDSQLAAEREVYEEVQSVKWASMEEIFSMIDEEVLIPYHKSLIELLFFMRNKKGTHTRF